MLCRSRASQVSYGEWPARGRSLAFSDDLFPQVVTDAVGLAGVALLEFLYLPGHQLVALGIGHVGDGAVVVEAPAWLMEEMVLGSPK